MKASTVNKTAGNETRERMWNRDGERGEEVKRVEEEVGG